MVAMADGNFNCQLHCHRTISYPDDDNCKVWRCDHTLGPRVTITFMLVALHRARKLQVSAVNRGLCSWKRSVSLGWLEAIDSSEHVRGCRGSLLYNICFWRHWWYYTRAYHDRREDHRKHEMTHVEHLPVARTGRAGIYAPSWTASPWTAWPECPASWPPQRPACWPVPACSGWLERAAGARTRCCWLADSRGTRTVHPPNRQ